MAKEQQRCDPLDPADDHRGDWWDHVAYDPESRLVVLCVVSRAHDVENIEAVIHEAVQRTWGRVMELMASDDDPAYETAILRAYGQVDDLLHDVQPELLLACATAETT